MLDPHESQEPSLGGHVLYPARSHSDRSGTGEALAVDGEIYFFLFSNHVPMLCVAIVQKGNKMPREQRMVLVTD